MVKMNRPTSITIITLLLGWFALGGLGVGILIITGNFNSFPIVLGFLSLAYSLSAITASLGLWKMKRWSLTALKIWMVVCITTLLVFIYLFGEYLAGGYIVGIVFTVVVTFLFKMLYKNVSSKIT